MKPTVTRITSGVIILGIGLAFLLQNMGVLDAGDFAADWWPVVIVIAGILLLVNNLRSFVGWFLIALGGIYQLKTLEVIDFEPWSVVWPLLIILGGASIIFRRTFTKNLRVNSAERDDLTAILAGATSTSTSKNFQAARVTAVMGGGVLDLRKATIKDGAVIDVFSFWGGVEIIVPQNVIVRQQINNILAGSEDKTNQDTDKNSPTLVITGDLIMAGVSVRNTPSEG